MFTVVGGLLAAVCWSAAGLASSVAGRRVGPMLALAWVNLAAMLLVVTAALVLDGVPHDIPGVEVAWVSIYGLALVGALAAAFKSMTLGPVGLVAPVISTEGAFATLFGLALGETVGGATGVALGLIVIGIVLSAIDTDPLGGGSMLAATAVNRKALSIGTGERRAVRDHAGGGQPVRHARRALDHRGRPHHRRAAHHHPGPGARAVPPADRRVADARRSTAPATCSAFSLFILATEDGVAVPAVLASQYATLTALFGLLRVPRAAEDVAVGGRHLTIAGTARGRRYDRLRRG